MRGTIKTLNERGYGFITPEDGSKDVFFHSSELVGVEFTQLQPGDTVTFEVVQSEKGPKASGVTRV